MIAVDGMPVDGLPGPDACHQNLRNGAAHGHDQDL
jgi:hypothetical protein